MIETIIDLAEEPAHLSVRNSLLVIARGGEGEITRPLDEVAVLCLTNPQVALTQPVLARLAEAGGVIIACNAKHMPAAMVLPLEGHVTQGERFRAQAEASEPTRKRQWQAIVKAKIRAQGRALQDLTGSDGGLAEMAAKVRSGDVGNLEAEAARRYWPALFEDPSFRRGRHAGRANPHLNYGYAVLRAMVARAVCAAGLHPGLGIHHHNRYDAFPLVDDLMEPFRPIVDRAVVLYCRSAGGYPPLDRQAKAHLIGTLTAHFREKTTKCRPQSRSLFDHLHRATSSLAEVFLGKRKTLYLPEI